MIIKGNPLLGRNFAFYGMKLNHNGLFYLNRLNHSSRKSGETHEIFITDDPAKILSIMDIKFEDVDKADEQTFYEILLGCEYFKTKRFTEDITEGGCEQFVKFAEYLGKNDFDPKYTKINFERIIKFFGNENDFLEKYTKSTAILTNPKDVKKLNGGIVLKYVPEYDAKHFSVAFPYYKENAFPDTIEQDYFYLTKSEKEIVDKFLEVTKGV